MVVRLASDVWNDTPTTESTDDAAPVIVNQVYDNTQVVSVQLPDTVGPWLDIDGVEYSQNSLQFVVKPSGGVIAAADPITVAEFALLKGGQGRIGDGTLAGPSVERDVIQANRGSVMSFGDLQFRVPSSGNSSLQMRYAAGVTTINDFVTKWSNQQGGASENQFGFNLGSAWAYFRANGSLNLTLHNSYQDATFVCNGWLYRVEVIVGSSWTNNRFSFSRWRLEGIKGVDGTNGTDGVAGAPGVDGTDGKGIVTSHRSDGATAIGGTVYTLDHVIYEYTDGTFQDMGLLIAPPATLDYFQGDNVEYLIPGEFWDGKQVYGRSFERLLNTGNVLLIANGVVDELLDFNGQLYHSWFGLNVAGDCTDSRYSWKIGFQSPTEKSVRYRSFGTSDAHFSSHVHKFWLKYTKQ